MLLCPVVGFGFIQAVALYSEASRSAASFPELARGLSPFDGVLVPTFGANILGVLIATATLVALSTVWLSPGRQLVDKMGLSVGVIAAGIVLATLAPQARLYADVTEN